MNNLIKILIFTILIINLSSNTFSKENFYSEGVQLFENEKYDDAKFLFERSIVFDPKHFNSYLYLAKIINIKKIK